MSSLTLTHFSERTSACFSFFLFLKLLPVRCIPYKILKRQCVKAPGRSCVSGKPGQVSRSPGRPSLQLLWFGRGSGVWSLTGWLHETLGLGPCAPPAWSLACLLLARRRARVCTKCRRPAASHFSCESLFLKHFSNTSSRTERPLFFTKDNHFIFSKSTDTFLPRIMIIRCLRWGGGREAWDHQTLLCFLRIKGGRQLPSCCPVLSNFLIMHPWLDKTVPTLRGGSFSGGCNARYLIGD